MLGPQRACRPCPHCVVGGHGTAARVLTRVHFQLTDAKQCPTAPEPPLCTLLNYANLPCWAGGTAGVMRQDPHPHPREAS